MSLKQIADRTLEIIGDYQNDYGITLTPENIVSWANQFDSDAEFVLTELNNIFEQTYISKQKARDLLKNRIEKLVTALKYGSVLDLISSSHFFTVQSGEKSQIEIIQIIDDILIKDYGIIRSNYDEFQKVNFIYFDDLIATGGTVCNHLCEWLTEKENGKTNHERVVDKEINLIVSCFCVHLHSYTLLEYILMKQVHNDKLQGKWKCYADIIITDHPKKLRQEYNCLIPLKSELSQRALSYLESLDANGQSDRAFRPVNTPEVDNLFSSASNRNKLECIFVEKGLDILESVDNLNINQRPLGITKPSHKTFGMGTLFFTWRNVPNNSPIVFWWKGHGWSPLFPLRNRGN